MLPLCVDLDETLIMIDSFYNSIFRMCCQKPWQLFTLLAHWRRGKTHAKAWLATHWPPNPKTLPYRHDLLDYLRQQKALGRKLYLVSASYESAVKSVADYLGMFDGVYGSSETFNVKGAQKASTIKKHIAEQFVYAGDSFADLAVWREASGAIVCGKATHIINQITVPIEKQFPATSLLPF